MLDVKLEDIEVYGKIRNSNTIGNEIVNEFKKAGVWDFKEVLKFLKDKKFDSVELDKIKKKGFNEDLTLLLALRVFLSKSQSFTFNGFKVRFGNVKQSGLLEFGHYGKVINCLVVTFDETKIKKPKSRAKQS